jgi:hypothetical protein
MQMTVNVADGQEKRGLWSRTAAVAWAIFFVWGAVTLPATAQKPESEWVSVINLIATPEKYHGKLVHVTGWASIEFENTTLCLAEKVVSTKECVWLEITEGPFLPKDGTTTYLNAEKSWKKFHHRVVTLEGIFDMKNTGHMGAYSSGIGKISKVLPHR